MLNSVGVDHESHTQTTMNREMDLFRAGASR